MKKRLISVFVLFILVSSIFALAEDAALVSKTEGIWNRERNEEER